MQLDLSNIQESIIPLGYHEGKKVKEVPVKYFQEMREKAPNKRTLTEKLLLNFINEENDKYNLVTKLSKQVTKLKVNGVDIITSLDKEREKKLNDLIAGKMKDQMDRITDRTIKAFDIPTSTHFTGLYPQHSRERIFRQDKLNKLLSDNKA